MPTTLLIIDVQEGLLYAAAGGHRVLRTEKRGPKPPFVI